MRPSHILFLIALLMAIAFVAYEGTRGRLKGRQLVLMVVVLTCFGVAWIANTFGW